MLGEWFKSLTAKDDNAEEKVSAELAQAVILMEIARADFDIAESESKTLRELMTKEFSVSADELDQLIQKATDISENTISLHQFIDRLNEGTNLESRSKLMKMIWKIAYADDRLDPQEEATARRLADLLHISHAEFIRSKLEVTGEI